ncbi:unnamed protein product [Caenorhabditis bovis]|uniref:DUF38 domain-containing protein n=2 Tax=Caenorhabditis bovis TaxID=2654633 RepID=A0A8S1EFC4_9PELO|nr:unnamed protein product [Caenorhabditis bovis]
MSLKQIALLLLLGSISNSLKLDHRYKTIDNVQYCSLQGEHSQEYAALTNPKAMYFGCVNFYKVIVFMVHWSDDDVRLWTRRMKHLRDVKLYIENTTATEVNFYNLRKMSNVHFYIKNNMQLKRIVFFDDAIFDKNGRAKNNFELEVYSNPLLTDEDGSLKRACKHCLFYRIYRYSFKIIDDAYDQINGKWCSFMSFRGISSSFYQPFSDIYQCSNLAAINLFMVDTEKWTVEKIANITTKIVSAFDVKLIIAYSKIELLDLSSMTFAHKFELYIMDNPNLRDIRLSEAIRTTRDLGNRFTVFSINNPKMSKKTYEMLVRICHPKRCSIETR